MKVVHCIMVSSGAGIPTTYAAQVLACRWRDQRSGEWHGRMVADTGARLELPSDLDAAERRREADALARAEAARLGLPAGPDVFPFAG